MGESNLGRVLLIANPAANNGRVKKVALEVRDALRTACPSVEEVQLVLTEQPAHATRIASSAHPWDTVVALGGDGVAHEVANGLMRIDEGDRPLFGLLPFGSGNDYARTLGMPTDLRAAVRALERAHPHRFDLGVCNGEFFLQTLSFGLDAAIALDTVKRRKTTRLSGAPLYLVSGLSQLIGHLDVHRARLSLDGTDPVSLDVHLLAIQNGVTYGGGFAVCPDARPDDAELDLCWVDGPQSVARATKTFLLAKGGKHAERPGVRFNRGSRIVVEFSGAVPAQIDGEELKGARFEIGVASRALSVLALV
ncbi:MAG: diacylglycerol kinase family lipid kinase [Berryella intestinalis]|uniref:diacylglycerol/lipid kinase family protein n=1 Tax=Berryella intestinalis TaxID=1531429 RepID=UPI002A4EA0A5|nr:diacylglycerol kinase family protein [Berryella intestinalis]MDD7368668.1 diacylglycerol kinase family lipid kinase [Berryella intestinalis]MDY3128644.1 diacylglycerol kinase family lipid kinase [Berryella intestinalis]